MKIQLIDLTVRDLVAGYRDDGEGGARGQLPTTTMPGANLAPR